MPPSTAQSDSPNPKKTGCLVAADGFMEKEGTMMAAKQPKSTYYRALYRIDR